MAARQVSTGLNNRAERRIGTPDSSAVCARRGAQIALLWLPMLAPTARTLICCSPLVPSQHLGLAGPGQLELPGVMPQERFHLGGVAE